MNQKHRKDAPAPARPLRVRFEESPGQLRELEFRETFVIGRIDECGVCVRNEFVSRRHAEVRYEDGKWQVCDLESRNGIFVDGVRLERVEVAGDVAIRLGIEGPTVELSVPVERRPSLPEGTDPKVRQYIDHYLREGADDEPAGDHTLMVRRAFSHLQSRQRRKFTWVVAGLCALVVAIGAYAVLQYRETKQQRELAEELFYSMKSLDVEIANLQRLVAGSNPQATEQVAQYQDRRRAMQKNYDRFLTALRVYDPKVTPEQRLILRVARIFGECEVAAPPDFTSEIGSYIRKWQSSPRLANAIRRAHDSGYTPVIVRELLKQGLPPQFFYLALQESNFDPYVSGPQTYKGIAKGMWQFIPETGAKYGLKIGPLVELRRADPGDERDQWDRATTAAAQYIKDLYIDDAQASGMLVMACYNWGEDKVLPLVRSMPTNPRERNFWRLLQSYRGKVPKETYDYVFYIVSAAVIGENPRMFGFDFENPLSHLEAE